MNSKTTRRSFILGSIAAATVVSTKTLTQQGNSSQSKSKIAIPQSMPERPLGNTKISLPIFGLGGAGQTPLSKAGQEKEAIALVERALALGVRYYDTAADYGPSEEYMGKILPEYRKEIFLNSKTAARDRDGAWRNLERSLKRLNTDYLDAWQLHHVSFESELDEIFGSNGAIKALEEAKEQNIVKFLGITGHHEPDIIAEGLRRYPFDTTLISLNAADVHHPRPFGPTVLPVAQANNVGVIAMKVPAYGRLFKPGILDNMQQAMGYTLSLSGVHCCIIAAENPEQLESNVKVAQAFQPLDETEMKAIEQLTINAGNDGAFFRKWT
ncbi:putative oxidoreductase, aryl-alcohol dehydrogenase like protein [Xenococcus sp. PCC 7305]|uniref:aldo/keto reductase n=1 Tax=Xenococcus sp. PCC 7305 TaxID=102125 RepID=UPI0002AD1813|nr:aldo/keto reductase [Xenococcus sp. PCC 7305]ELS04129.1 putative oxidoreductase, aryl-alcohol dehydrogenase like protein [Xenococcus sp. PCC 7305]